MMPERFAGYQRQRFRWIFGPATEFRRHWRLFLPGRLARPSRLRPSQKVLMASHGLRELVLSAASWRLLRGEPGCSGAAALRAVLWHLALSGATRAAGATPFPGSSWERWGWP